MSRIDRFLVSRDWESYFSRITQSTLPRPVSDHFPILLDGGGIRSEPSPFRFENMWLKAEGFKDLLKGWWQGLSFKGSTSFILAEKLKGLKGKLKVWNKEVFGNVSTRRAEALFRVGCWDNVEKDRELSLEESEERTKAKDDYRRWSLFKEKKIGNFGRFFGDFSVFGGSGKKIHGKNRLKKFRRKIEKFRHFPEKIRFFPKKSDFSRNLG